MQTWDHTAGATFLHNVFQGLSSCQGVEELVFMPGDGDVGVHPCVFDVRGDKFLNMANSFSKLKKLKLDLTSAPTYHHRDKNSWNSGYPAKIMKEATQLKVLMVIAETYRSDIIHRTPQNGYRRSNFDAVLNDCSFPELKSLYLANFTADGQVIIDFLERHPKLEDLVIDGFLLHSGSWSLIVVYLRQRCDRNQSLTNVSINNLYGGLPLLSWDPFFHEWVCSLCLFPACYRYQFLLAS